MPIESITSFVIASLLLGLSPGPDNFYVLSQSSLHGFRAGLFVTLGLCTGLLVHTSLVAFGVAALIMTSTLAFTILQGIGVVYLIYLAWQSFSASTLITACRNTTSLSALRYYQRGIIMNVTNPKVSLFFLAFLPQFTNPQTGDLALQVLLLGSLFIVVTLLVFGSIALVAASLEAWINHSPKTQLWLHRVVALVFVGLAIKLAMFSLYKETII